MKIATAICGVLGVLTVSLFGGCGKEALADLTDDQLTECAYCDLLYTESAKLDGFTVANGNKLVFQYKAYWGPEKQNYTGLFFEVGASQRSFTMGKKEIASGAVKHQTMCPACDYVLLEAVDGSIRGKKLAGDR